ncbi:unnamed protein product [Closterium sp. NIES-64]|nr:unnamed protein product [Closterium sp. NIES-64]
MPGVLTMGGRGPGAVDKLDLAKARVGSGRGVACRNLLSHAQAISEVNGGIEQLGATKFQFYTCVPYTEKKSPYSTFSHISTLALHRLPLYGLLDHTSAPHLLLLDPRLPHCMELGPHNAGTLFIQAQVVGLCSSPSLLVSLLHAVGFRLDGREDELGMRLLVAERRVGAETEPSRCHSAESDVYLGAAWLGAAWLGAAWLGAAWLGAAWLGAAWLGAAWLGAAWLGAAWLGAAWLGAAWLGAAWLGAAWLGAAWLGAAWLGAAWLGAWLGAAWLGAAWLGAAWLGAAWLGAAWLGAAWLGAAWLGAAWLGGLHAWLAVTFPQIARARRSQPNLDQFPSPAFCHSTTRSSTVDNKQCCAYRQHRCLPQYDLQQHARQHRWEYLDSTWQQQQEQGFQAFSSASNDRSGSGSRLNFAEALARHMRLQVRLLDTHVSTHHVRVGHVFGPSLSNLGQHPPCSPRPARSCPCCRCWRTLCSACPWASSCLLTWPPCGGGGEACKGDSEGAAGRARGGHAAQLVCFRESQGAWCPALRVPWMPAVEGLHSCQAELPCMIQGSSMGGAQWLFRFSVTIPIPRDPSVFTLFCSPFSFLSAPTPSTLCANLRFIQPFLPLAPFLFPCPLSLTPPPPSLRFLCLLSFPCTVCP